MEQRPLRLGDLVDDYCPRERRVTNHAIVAIVDDAIRQTRCSTCEAEHLYKAGRPPLRRKKDPTAELIAEVMATAPGQIAASGLIEPPEPLIAAEPMKSAEGAGDDPAADSGASAEVDERPDHVWSAHRVLIRATLPRTEGDVPPPRPIPEFTMHQRHNGGGAFRHGRGWQDRSGGQGRNGPRGDGRSGNGPGFGPAGPGQGHGRPRRHGKKRPR